VAEAVETASQVAILRQVGADVGQGYFFAPPLAADEALALTSHDALPLFSLSVAATDDAAHEPDPDASSSATATSPRDAGPEATASDNIEVAVVAGSADSHSAGGRSRRDEPSSHSVH